MTEILKALDAITSRVLAYRPKEKGVAATKMRKQIEKAEREAKREEGDPLTTIDLSKGKGRNP